MKNPLFFHNHLDSARGIRFNSLPFFYTNHSCITMPFFGRKRLILAAMGMSILLTSCVSKVAPDEISKEAVFSVKTDLPSLKSSAEEGKTNWQWSHYLAADAKPWWQQFDDPVLHEFIRLSLKNSRNLALLAGRLEEAVANARASRADLFPTITLNGQASVSSNDLEEAGLQSNPDRINASSANFSLSWQTDIFGQLRNVSAADKARLQAESSRLRDAQRLLVSEVVQNYYRLVSIRDRIELTRASVARRAENVDRIDQLLEQGYATVLDKTRTDSQLYEARGSLAQLELDEITLLNQLSLLSGTALLQLRVSLQKTGQLPLPENSAPLPSISLLVQHRPDLRAVERDLVSAAYNVNSSVAALYPTLGFRVDVGKEAVDDLSGSFPALDVITGSVIANLAMPILGRGRRLAAINVNSARLKQAHATFEETALRVISEIDTAIASIDKNRVIYEQRELASASAKEAAELSKELFKAGELDYTSVILAEQTRVSSENNAINAKQVFLNAYIVYMAAVAPAW